MSADQDLTTQRVIFSPIEFDVYERSKANILRLKERLPDDLVANLAREVIRRVASKDQEFDPAKQAPDQEYLETLCNALIAANDKEAEEMIGGLRAEGAKAEAIYLKHLSASARLLGEWWEEDRVNFTQVTLGTGRMFAIMRSMRHLFEPDVFTQDRTALFASVPGEDHTMGVRMAADLFRKEGWEIGLKIGLDHDSLVAEIEKSPHGIVGLSISGQHSIDALSRLVVALNICCPHVRILVSGQNIKEVRPILSLMGLDGIAGTIEEAKEQMSALWDKTSAG